jgi:mRNA interferase RelE/StbE
VLKYEIVLARKARKQLDKLPDSIAEPIFKVIGNLAEDPRPNGSKKLQGRNGYRIRIGDYRVLYEIFDSQLIIDVITVGHRRDVD